MKEYSEVFIGLDVAKAKHAVAIADAGRAGEVRYQGEIESSPAAVARLVAKLARRHQELHFCYEAGPTGYGLYRQLRALGHECVVVAPSLIPRKPGDRIKTNRRDAVSLARLLRAGELTSVWVPDTTHEAVRDLVRSRDAAAADQRRARQRLGSFLLRTGRTYEGRTAWGRAHLRWLATQKFEHPAQQIVFQEAIEAIADCAARLDRLDKQLAILVPNWSLAPVVEACQAMRGISFLGAVGFVAEIGDLRRFDNPRQLMAFIGLVPCERSTGEKVRRGGITLAGNRRVRWKLIEAAWSYRFPARVGPVLRARLEGQPKTVREIAWKAQVRLCGRYRRLTTAGKPPQVATVAIAREVAAFLWDIARQITPTSSP